MSQSPFERAGNLRIGAVDFVSPDEIKVALDIEAPESVALFDDGVRPFPRVNGYLLIPVEETFLVGQVEWLTVEHSQFPKRRGMKDFGLVDLPYPLRKLRLNPLGTLRRDARGYAFTRGSDALPSVGATVILPTEKQLRSIVESGEHRRVKIGTSALAGDANVFIDPNRLFGRHLAVLGNTGSGKSCSVAGLIRWSIEEAVKELEGKQPNARFIVLDPNGEYSHAFDGNDVTARVFGVNQPEENKATDLKVPLWFWNSAEWCSFTQASAKMQRPLLRRALREVKADKSAENTKKLKLRLYLSNNLAEIQQRVDTNAIKAEEGKFGYMLQAIRNDLVQKDADFPGQGIDKIRSVIDGAIKDTFHSFFDKSGKKVEYYRAFSEGQATNIMAAMQDVLDKLGGIIYHEGPDEDVPLQFDGATLADHLEMLAIRANASQHIDPLVARIRTFLSDSRMNAIISDTGGLTLESWLNGYIGGDQAKDGCVSIIDLSMVPTEIVHVITAVIARMVFEAQQRCMKLDEKKRPLPTVLVMEEAHTFVKRTRDDTGDEDAASICCQAFEKIAREGRKFGLGLVVSSQRPSELSPTVLSQCNSFLLHRISNDRDQERVQRLVPDNLRGIMRELPLLPSQNAILLGWASELPVLVKMNDLPELQQPRSKDPDFWEVWVGKNDKGETVDRSVDWEKIANDWRNLSTGKSGDGG